MATNRRQQIRLSPDEQAAFFRERKKAALATIDRDGFPHVVAINYFARGGAFYMTSYGKAQKVVNIRRNPKVALMIEAGDDYAELRGVMIRGRCEILEDEASVRSAFEARAGAQANASPVRPGAVWANEIKTDTVVRLDPNTDQLRVFALPSKDVGIRKMIVDADGRLWYMGSHNGRLGVIE